MLAEVAQRYGSDLPARPRSPAATGTTWPGSPARTAAPASASGATSSLRWRSRPGWPGAPHRPGRRAGLATSASTAPRPRPCSASPRSSGSPPTPSCRGPGRCCCSGTPAARRWPSARPWPAARPACPAPRRCSACSSTPSRSCSSRRPRRRWATGCARCRPQNLAIREHEHAPLHEIQRWAGRAGQALFDTLLVFENYPIDKALRERGAGLRIEELSNVEATSYPLTLAVVWGDTLAITFDYGRDSFDRGAVETLAAHLLGLLAQLAEDPARPLAQISLLGAAERAAVAAANRRTPSPAGPPVHVAIARQAQIRAAATAVVGHGARLSFGALDRRANRLAHRLRRLGVGPEVLVGIALPARSTWWWPCWRSGRPAAPTCPSIPPIPPSASPSCSATPLLGVLLTDRSLRDRLPMPRRGDRGLPRRRGPDGPARRSIPPSPLQPGNLAYLIYTSGSTGQPKAVAVAHDSLAMHLRAAGRSTAWTPATGPSASPRSASTARSSRLWLPWSTGPGVVLSGSGAVERRADGRRRSSGEGVTIIYPPTAHLAAARRLGPDAPVAPCRCGSAPSAARPSRATPSPSCTAPSGPKPVINGYGPTETVITPLLWRSLPDTPCETPYAPIGQAVGDRTDLRPRPRPRPAARGRRRRAVHRRLRDGPRLPRASRADRRALRARSLRRPPGRPALPHRRSGAGPRRRRLRIPRPHRPAGQDPGLPHRARRDRGPRSWPAAPARRWLWRARSGAAAA